MKTLFEFIKDNWRTWPTNADFARAHDISPQQLNGWLRAEYTTDGKNVFSGTTSKMARVDGVEFRVRGVQCK